MGGGADGDAWARAYLRALSRIHHPKGHEHMTEIADADRNGVDTTRMFATLDAIKAQPELGRFQFRATNRWIDGAHDRNMMRGC
jgi:hypothetical protein